MIILDSNKYYNLGSVSMTSDLNGTVSQYIEYIPFGEEMFSAHRNTYNSPYRYSAKELDEETGLYYYGARYYNPKLSIWLSVDPMVEKYISLSPYNYMMNNPVNMIDPDGREPNKLYAGTVYDFISILNNSSRQVGKFKGSKADEYMRNLSNTKWSWSQFKSLPTETGYFNRKIGRYIYTKESGWIDMTHFLFYSSKAYKYKIEKEDAIKIMNSEGFNTLNENRQAIIIEKSNMDPVGEAIQDGYLQEWSDKIFAKHSAFSYEDLPSDKFGAEFGTNYFDPNSKLTFGEQLENYMKSLGATQPQNAPNYDTLPNVEPDKKPSLINKTTTPLYTNENT